jgi:TonB family protein
MSESTLGRDALNSTFDRLFGPLLLLSCLLFTLAAVQLYHQGTRALQQPAPGVGMHKTTLVLELPQQREVAQPPVQRPKAPAPSQPLDLSDAPVLAQPQDEQQRSVPSSKQSVRRVYGLRKVYAQGLGSGGAMSDAVIGKLGNTLAKDIDTLSATAAELKGTVVSASTVTRAPRFKNRVKPQYSAAMLEQALEGVVKVKVLVDIDGRVKDTRVLSDIGEDSALQATKACAAMEFEPAVRDEQPVAVWIIIPIRFVMLG